MRARTYSPADSLPVDYILPWAPSLKAHGGVVVVDNGCSRTVSGEKWLGRSLFVRLGGFFSSTNVSPNRNVSLAKALSCNLLIRLSCRYSLVIRKSNWFVIM
jgi:hypothetical protein